MKLFELIQEAPLPDDWDKNIYSDKISFEKRIQYAKERSKQIGRGSSRTAFEVPYEGRRTVLKIANNSKGMVQNEEEVQLLGDNYLQSIGITIPMIDYDEQNSSPTWLHTEYAHKITQAQLEKYVAGVSMHKVTQYLDQQTGRAKTRNTLPDEVFETDLFAKLENLVLNFNMPAGDLARKANWGLYEGNPVIIDLGWTDNTAVAYGR